MGGNDDVSMIDVGEKEDTDREAVAEGRVSMSKETLDKVLSGQVPKGDVLNVSKTAGIMGAKKTSDLLPLCHPLPVESVEVDIKKDESLPGLRVISSVKYRGKTGVEMEALTACSISLLSIYDMIKGIERGVEIHSVRLLEKRGGASGEWTREE